MARSFLNLLRSHIRTPSEAFFVGGDLWRNLSRRIFKGQVQLCNICLRWALQRKLDVGLGMINDYRHQSLCSCLWNTSFRPSCMKNNHTTILWTKFVSFMDASAWLFLVSLLYRGTTLLLFVFNDFPSSHAKGPVRPQVPASSKILCTWRQLRHRPDGFFKSRTHPSA